MDQREATRVRDGWRITIRTEAGAPGGLDRIAACRRTLAEIQSRWVDGFMLNTFTASAVVRVHDGLINPFNRARFQSYPMAKMANIAFKVLARASE